MFEIPSCDNFLDILTTELHYGPLKEAKPTNEDNPALKKGWVSYFLMRNHSMNFQNPILNCVWTDGRTYKRKAICPFNFSNVGGIINELISCEFTP